MEAWILSAPDKSRTWASEVYKETRFDYIYCATDPGHERRGRRLTPLSVAVPHRLKDFVWVDSQAHCLVTERVVRFLELQQLTGYELIPVKARYKAKTSEQPPPLWKLIVTGWAGIAPPASGVRLEIDCPTCGHLHYSSVTDPSSLLDEAQWDGSDLFLVWPYPYYRLVTNRVAQLVREAGLTGVELEPLASLVRASYEGWGLSPGRLSDHMPEPRARQLGEPLGIY